MSRIKNSGLDQSGADPFEQQQFGPADAEGVQLCYFSFIIEHAIQLMLIVLHVPLLDKLLSREHL